MIKRRKHRKSKIKFSKKVVVFCIAFIVLYTIAQSYISYKIGLELSPTLTTCVYTFFGGELALTLLSRVFDKEDGKVSKKKEPAKYNTVTNNNNNDSVG